MRKPTSIKLLLISFLLIFNGQPFAQDINIDFNNNVLMGGGDLDLRYTGNLTIDGAQPAEIKLINNMDNILSSISFASAEETDDPGLLFDPFDPTGRFKTIQFDTNTLAEMYEEKFKQNVGALFQAKALNNRVIRSSIQLKSDGLTNCPELTNLNRNPEAPTFQCFEKRSPNSEGQWVITRENALDVCSCLLDGISKDALFSQEEYQTIELAKTTAIKNKAADQFLHFTAESSKNINMLKLMNEKIPEECESMKDNVENSCSDNPLSVNNLRKELRFSLNTYQTKIDSEQQKKTILPFIKAAIELSPQYPRVDLTYDNLMNPSGMNNAIFRTKFIAAVQRNGLPDFDLKNLDNLESEILFKHVSRSLETELNTFGRRLISRRIDSDGTLDVTISPHEMLQAMRKSLTDRAKRSCLKTTVNASIYCNISNDEARDELLKQSVLLCDQQQEEPAKDEKLQSQEERKEADRTKAICNTLNIDNVDFSLLESTDTISEKYRIGLPLDFGSFQAPSLGTLNFNRQNLLGLNPLVGQSRVNNEFYDHVFRCEYYTSLVHNASNTLCVELKDPAKIDECQQLKAKLSQLKEDNITKLMLESGMSEAEARAIIEENFKRMSEHRDSFFSDELKDGTAFTATEKDTKAELGDGNRRITDGSVINNETPATNPGAKTSGIGDSKPHLMDDIKSDSFQTPLPMTSDSSDDASDIASSSSDARIEEPTNLIGPMPKKDLAAKSFFGGAQQNREIPVSDDTDKAQDLAEEESEIAVTNALSPADEMRIAKLEQQIAEKDDKLKEALAKLNQAKLQSEQDKLAREAEKLEKERAELERERKELEAKKTAAPSSSRSALPATAANYAAQAAARQESAKPVERGAPMDQSSGKFSGSTGAGSRAASQYASAVSGDVNGQQYVQSTNGAGLQLSRTQNVVLDRIEGNALVITREMFEQGKFRQNVNELYISTDKGYEKYIKNEEGQFVPETEIVKIKHPLEEAMEQVGEAQDDPSMGIPEIPPLLDEPKAEEPRRRDVVSNEELEDILNSKPVEERPSDKPVPRPDPSQY